MRRIDGFFRLLVIAAIVLGASACGRKGPLDAPPGTAVSRAPSPAGPAADGAAPAATPNSKRDSPLDWLLK